jgi:hypothetical protein
MVSFPSPKGEDEKVKNTLSFDVGGVSSQNNVG